MVRPMPASGTEKLLSPAPCAASAALAASLQGLGVLALADASDEACEAGADAEDEGWGAADDEAVAADADVDADAADADDAEAEAELPLPEADALLEEPLEQPTMPIASTAANTIASSFLLMIVPSLSIGAPAARMSPDAGLFCSVLALLSILRSDDELCPQCFAIVFHAAEHARLFSRWKVRGA